MISLCSYCFFNGITCFVEIVCIYFGTFSDDNFKPFEDVARKEWLQDNSIRQDIKVLKLTFYKNAEAADAWEPTKCKVYLFRE